MSPERFQAEEVPYAARQPAATPYSVPYDYSSADWSLNYAYIDPHYMPYQTAAMQSAEPPNSPIPLHAPIPISGYSTLLASTPDATGEVAYQPYSYVVPPHEESKPDVSGEVNPLDVYLDAPQVLFPTPSELLTDLNTRERGARNDGPPSKGLPKPPNRSSGSRAKAEVTDEPENLNQRKAYFRSVSENVGFTITDPDTITSHDKKRCYLECLEEYVQWMHEQLRLVGHEPLQLERVSSYRGLKSRSIRTMLVRKQDDIRKLHQRKLQEEQKFMDLQNALLMQQLNFPKSGDTL